MSTQRQNILDIYCAALAEVNGARRTSQWLKTSAFGDSVAVIAIGKAAASMMQGALSVLEDQAHDALIITKKNHGENFLHCPVSVQCLEAGHPTPDERSLVAGEELLSFIHNQPPSCELLFLISGGASALVEVLPTGVHLKDLQLLNDWLLACGFDISTMNHMRSRLSRIKGGLLAQHLGGRKTSCLMISDVPDDLPHIIGSGLLFPEPLQQNIALPELPQWINQLLKQASKQTEDKPVQNDPCFNLIEAHIIANLGDARQAAARAAQSMGYSVVLHEKYISGDAYETGLALARTVKDTEPALHIWGGETTVCLPDSPGRGGRNQHLALAAATVLDGCDDCWLLAAGTDGSDGPTDDAGALVDGGTLSRGRSAGLSAETSLVSADAGSFLAVSHDLIQTGPTGTNVMDLVIGLREKL